jgi:cytochrome o ubiquinol oxidase operon protein cyoD
MLRSYTIGFGLALVLTAIPFGIVATKAATPATTLAVIAVLALVQVLVHLRYFLHLNLASSPRENLLALCFAAILIVVMIGGSLWIMIDLHQRMMPA